MRRYTDRLFGGLIPGSVHEDDREALLRQLYLSMGSQLLGGAASGQDIGSSLAAALQQMQTVGPAARQLQDRRSQQEYYALQRQLMMAEEARDRELHPLAVKSRQSELDASSFNIEQAKIEAARRDKQLWDADDDITIANQQRRKIVPEMKAALQAMQSKLVPEQVQEINARIAQIQSFPNEALSTEQLRELELGIYNDIKAYSLGERQFNEMRQSRLRDDNRLTNNQQFNQGKPKVSRFGTHLQLTYPDGTIEYQAIPEEVVAGEVDLTGKKAGAAAEAKAPFTNSQGKDITPQMAQAELSRALKSIAATLGVQESELSDEDVARAEAIAARNLGIARKEYLKLIGQSEGGMSFEEKMKLLTGSIDSLINP